MLRSYVTRLTIPLQTLLPAAWAAFVSILLFGCDIFTDSEAARPESGRVMAIVEEGTASSRVLTMRRDGSDVSDVTPPIAANVLSAAVSSDGAKIAVSVVTARGEYGLLSARTDGDDWTWLLRPQVAFPAVNRIEWNPSDRYLSLLSSVGATPPWGTTLLDLQTREFLYLNEVRSPVWSPDGRFLAFRSDSGYAVQHGPFGSPYLWAGHVTVYDTRNGSRTTVLADSAYNDPVGWSKDGKEIVFRSDRDHRGGWDGRLGGPWPGTIVPGASDLYRVALDGTQTITRLTQAGEIPRSAVPARGDSYLYAWHNWVYRVDLASGETALVQVDLDTYVSARIMAWSPEGNKILLIVEKQDGAQQHLVTVDVESGDASIIFSAHRISYADW